MAEVRGSVRAERLIVGAFKGLDREEYRRVREQPHIMGAVLGAICRVGAVFQREDVAGDRIGTVQGRSSVQRAKPTPEGGTCSKGRPPAEA